MLPAMHYRLDRPTHSWFIRVTFEIFVSGRTDQWPSKVAPNIPGVKKFEIFFIRASTRGGRSISILGISLHVRAPSLPNLSIRKFQYQGLTIPLLIPGTFFPPPINLFFTFPHVRKRLGSLERDFLHSQMPEKPSGPQNEIFYNPPCQKILVPGARPGLP
jgi:hypothetical protein